MPESDPVAAFEQVAAAHARCFWLDGGGAREWSGRRSLVGWLDPGDLSFSYDATTGLVTRHRDGRAETVRMDPFAVLAEEMAGDSASQWFGYLGYASRPDLPTRPSTLLPDAVWMRPTHVRLFEHADAPRRPAAGEAAAAEAVPEWYADAFDAVQEQLHAGNTYELNLTFREQIRDGIDPAAAYLRLRELNPAPYAGFLQHDVPDARAWLLSSSPERYAAIDADQTIETKPIKGTTPRGAAPQEDEAQRHRLASEPKFRAENLMVVDLLRNDLAMVCEPGSVEVSQLMAVESYETVHQLVSTVRGRLREGVTSVEALRSLFPAGSMTGAPKLRTMQIVEEVEATGRGAYAGAFGWIAGDGRADLGVVIRSLMTDGSGVWELGSGGGITVGSDVEDEWAEARLKAERLRAVFAASQAG